MSEIKQDTSSQDAGQFLDYQLAFCEFDPVNNNLLKSGEFIDERHLTLKWSSMSLGLDKAPCMLAVAEAERSGITGQIALQITISAVKVKARSLAAEREEPLTAARVVRETLREANQQVYQYAHSMGRGGQLAATAQVFAFDGQTFAVGRVGKYENYLWRGEELIRLHEGQTLENEKNQAGILRRFIGANAQVLVDLAAVKLYEGDTIVISSLPWRDEFEVQGRMILRESASLETAAENLAILGAELTLVPRGALSYVLGAGVFVGLLHVGRPVVALKQKIEPFLGLSR